MYLHMADKYKDIYTETFFIFSAFHTWKSSFSLPVNFIFKWFL